MTREHQLVLAVVMTLVANPAHATNSVRLRLELATEAATEAIRVCAARQFSVAATVVNSEGVIQVQLRGDGSPVHSLAFSFRKALTTASMGPMFGVDSSSGVIKSITSKNPVGLGNIGAGNTDLLFLPGGVLLKSKGESFGALGVSGAPVSSEDEICARAGAEKIGERLERVDALSK